MRKKNIYMRGPYPDPQWPSWGELWVIFVNITSGMDVGIISRPNTLIMSGIKPPTGDLYWKYLEGQSKDG